MDSSKKAQRAVIQFLSAEGVSGTDIYSRIKNVYGTECMSGTAVFRWCSDFRHGRVSTADMPRPGQAGQCPSSCGKSLQRSAAVLPMGSSPSPPPPYSPDLSPCDFHVFGPLKKITEGTPVHKQRWGPRNRWRMVPHATQDFLCWRYPSSRGPMEHLFQPTRRLCVDSRQLHRYCLCTTLQFIIYTCI